MSTELPLSAPPSVDEVIVCPECTCGNPATETYCTACGAALHGAPPDTTLVPLAPGAVLADSYRIETVESFGRENRYAARRQDETDGRVLLREREREEAESLRVLAARTTEVVHPAVLVPEQYFEHEGRG